MALHPQLATRRLDVLHTRLGEEKAALLGWLDSLSGHLYRLYLLTGNQACLAALPMIERLRTDAAAVDAAAPAPLPELGELTDHLHRITLLLNGQVDQEGEGTPGSGK